jgi:hypothetical protein
LATAVTHKRPRIAATAFRIKSEARQLLEGLIAVERSRTPPWGARERRDFALCLALSATVYLAYAVFSTGYHHADEYFQVIEFASAKRGLGLPSELAWESAARARSWLQPAMYVGIAKLAMAFDVQRPLTLLLVFRLVTGLVSWCSLWLLIAVGRRWLAGEGERRALYWVAALFCLLPYLGVRTSSETLSAAALCIGIALLEWRSERTSPPSQFGLAVLAGVAFGLCFEFRFSTAAMAAGAALCHLRPAPQRLSLFAGLTLGGLSALALGLWVDRWGYGETALPVLSYLHQNFVVGQAAKFGVAPFFAYLYIPLLTPLAPLMALMVPATLIAWWRRPGHVVVWATLPYVAMLSLTAHKESRFPFPLAPLLPFLLMFALTDVPDRARGAVEKLRWLTSGIRLKLLAGWSVAGLLVGLWLPTLGDFPIYRLIEGEAAAWQQPLEIVALRGERPRPFWRDSGHMGFIEPKNLAWTLNPPVSELDNLRDSGRRFLTLVDPHAHAAEPFAWVTAHCDFAHSSWPQWMLPYNWFRWQDRVQWWDLYVCKPR